MNFSKKNHELKKSNRNFVSKAKFTLIIALLITINAVAQQGINYKALMKDANGNVLAETSISIQFNIQYEPQGFTIVYSEEHSVDTDANGIVIVNIGDGTQTSEDDPFSEIEWSDEEYYLNVEVDISGGTNYVDMGTTQFMAVPYAKHATTATTALNTVKNINGLTDGKSDNNGSSLFIGLDAGANDDGTNNQNVGIGYHALYENTTGVYNTANGYQALNLNTTGNYNTANGSLALNSNTSGSNNTANGLTALFSNTTGSNNTANGYQALNLNTTGSSNTANGFETLYKNTADHNTANGYQALYENTTGGANTANGYQALYNHTTGNWNTANGYQALYNHTTGIENTAIGDLALYSNISGSGNVALGNDAGSSETGSNKLYIANSGTDTPLIYGEFDNKILILNAATTVNESTDFTFVNAINGIKTHTGYNDAAGVYGGNTVSDGYGIGVVGQGGYIGVQGAVSGAGTVGHYGVHGRSYGINTGTNYGVYGRASNGNTNYAMYANGNMTVTGTFSNPSDRKLKTNIKTMANVMPSILKLKPKTYKITTEFVKKMNMPTGLQNGFIAQELKEVFPELVSNNVHPGETKNDEPIEYLGINYNGIIPVLVKAIQEQQETIESLQSTVSSQKEDYNALLKRIVQLEKNK